jgi:hypothetical protein
LGLLQTSGRGGKAPAAAPPNQGEQTQHDLASFTIAGHVFWCKAALVAPGRFFQW